MAAYASPNYTEAASGQEDHYRNGRKTPNHSLGYAMDVGSYDAAGNLIDNGTNEAGAPAYTSLGRTAYDAMGTFDPAAQKLLRAGVNFNDQDSMHYDVTPNKNGTRSSIGAVYSKGPHKGEPVHNIYTKDDDYSAPRYMDAFSGQFKANNQADNASMMHPEALRSVMPHSLSRPDASLGLGAMDMLSPNNFNSFSGPTTDTFGPSDLSLHQAPAPAQGLTGQHPDFRAPAPGTVAARTTPYSPQSPYSGIGGILGAPVTAAIQAANKIGSMFSSAPVSQPAHPSTPTPNTAYGLVSKPAGVVSRGADLSAPAAPSYAGAGVRGYSAPQSTASPSYQGPGQRGYSPEKASSYDTLGMTAGPTGFSTGGMFGAGPQAMGAAMGAFGAPKQAAQSLSHPISKPSFQSVANPDYSSALSAYNAAVAANPGPAPGTPGVGKPGETAVGGIAGIGQQNYAAPNIAKLQAALAATPKFIQQQVAAPPVMAKPLAAPVQSLPHPVSTPKFTHFTAGAPVFNDAGAVVGVYGANGSVNKMGAFGNANAPGSFGGLFGKGEAALGSGLFGPSAIGGYQSGNSNAYGNQNYGTRSYGGNGGSTLGGGDNHRAL